MDVLTRRHDTSSLTDSELAELVHDPYEKAPKYAKVAVVLVATTILCFGTANILHKLSNSNVHLVFLKKRFRRIIAAYRFFSSRQRDIHGVRYPVLGSGLLILVLSAILLIWSFAQTPYYRSRWNVGSPPLAIRTGFFALGLFPFILVFGSKRNIIAFIVGVSHEKLQVYHQWLSQLFMVLSLLHTFPFVIAGLREIKADTGGLTQLTWSWKVGKVYYWTGTAMLITLSWLCWASFSPLRNRYYETFKLFHLISAALFFAFFFMHCNKLLGSWNYLYATVAIYGLSVFARFGLIFWSNGLHISRGKVTVISKDVLKLTVTTRRKWQPGQHFFFNFVRHRPFQSHPFTVSSICSHGSTINEMEIYIRQGTGMTETLDSLVNRSTPMLLDGPYGGPDVAMNKYDQILLISGGIGYTFTYPIFKDLVISIFEQRSNCRYIDFVWTVRTLDLVKIIEEDLRGAQDLLPGRVRIFIHYTGISDGEKEGKIPEDLETSGLGILPGRPHVATYLSDSITATKGGSLAVATCGPSSLTFDVRNAVADAQLDILDGFSRATEIYLHSEQFAW